MIQTQRAGWISRGWMSFTVASTAVLHLGGASATAPTAQFSNGISNGTSFLANGIPQNAAKTRFLDVFAGETNGHTIRHAIITIISDGGAAPSARRMSDSSVPTSTLGVRTLITDVIVLENSRTDIFNFKMYNGSGGNAVYEVEVFE